MNETWRDAETWKRRRRLMRSLLIARGAGTLLKFQICASFLQFLQPFFCFSALFPIAESGEKMDNKQEIETVDIFLNFQYVKRLAIHSHDGLKFDCIIYPVLKWPLHREGGGGTQMQT